MEINTPNQPINPPITPIQPISKPVNKHGGFFPIILGVLILLVLVGGAAYYLGTKNSRTNQASNINTQPTISPQNNIEANLTATPSLLPTSIQTSTVNDLSIKARARDVQRKSGLRQIQSVLELYRSDVGTYPAALPACGSPLVSGGVTYVQKFPCDPTNNGKLVDTYVINGNGYKLIACLENTNDTQKDALNNAAYCSGGSTNWSYTLQNP